MSDQLDIVSDSALKSDKNQLWSTKLFGNLASHKNLLNPS